jgi:hypothetical protein
MGSDINNDGCINLIDIMQCAKLFNTISTNPLYDPAKDYNLDGSINMQDIVIISSHFNTNANNYTAK